MPASSNVATLQELRSLSSLEITHGPLAEAGFFVPAIGLGIVGEPGYLQGEVLRFVATKMIPYPSKKSRIRGRRLVALGTVRRDRPSGSWSEAGHWWRWTATSEPMHPLHGSRHSSRSRGVARRRECPANAVGESHHRPAVYVHRPAIIVEQKRPKPPSATRCRSRRHVGDEDHQAAARVHEHRRHSSGERIQAPAEDVGANGASTYATMTSNLAQGAALDELPTSQGTEAWHPGQRWCWGRPASRSAACSAAVASRTACASHRQNNEGMSDQHVPDRCRAHAMAPSAIVNAELKGALFRTASAAISFTKSSGQLP